MLNHAFEGRFLGARFEAKVPTLFEYIRKTYDIASHEALIVNAEDRTNEEFYSFSNHHLFGTNYRSSVLSLFRYKEYILRNKIAGFTGKEKALSKMKKELRKMEELDYRTKGEHRQGKPESGVLWIFEHPGHYHAWLYSHVLRLV